MLDSIPQLRNTSFAQKPKGHRSREIEYRPDCPTAIRDAAVYKSLIESHSQHQSSEE